MRRFISAVFALVIAVAVTACGNTPQTTPQTASETIVSDVQAQQVSDSVIKAVPDSSAIVVETLKKLRESLPRENDVYSGLGGADSNGCANNSSSDKLARIYNWMQRHADDDNLTWSTGETVESVKKLYRQFALAYMREQLAYARKGALETDCDGAATIFAFDEALGHMRELQIPPEQIEGGLTIQKLRGIMARLAGIDVRSELERHPDYAGLAREAGEGSFYSKGWYHDYQFTCAEMGLTADQCKRATEWPKQKE